MKLCVCVFVVRAGDQQGSLSVMSSSCSTYHKVSPLGNTDMKINHRNTKQHKTVVGSVVFKKAKREKEKKNNEHKAAPPK